MSSTTSLMSQIENDLKKNKSLQSYIPNLIQTIGSKRRIVLTNMNNKQKLSQLQQMLEEEMKNIQLGLQNENIDLDLENQEQQSDLKQQSIEGEQSEDQDQLEDQEQLDMKDQYQSEGEQQQLDEQQLEQEDEDEEFKQPQFDKKVKKNNRHQQQSNQQDEQGIQQQQGEQQQQNQGQQGDEQQQQMLDSNEQDIGLYGEQLNNEDEDMQDYQNEFDEEQFNEFQKQYGEQANKNTKSKSKKQKFQQDGVQDNIDQNIQDNFDHFREVQLENYKQEEQTAHEKTQLDHQIDHLQDKIIAKKDWTMKGQVKARQRPSNSLLQYDLQFSSGIKYTSQITQQKNSQLQQLIKKRILSQMFDDRTRFVNSSHIREHFGSLKQVSRQKSKMGLGELYQSQFKNFLGIGENKNDNLKTEIMNSFKELNYFLDSLSNFSFTPKPTKQNTKNSKSQAIIVEQKVALTLWNGQKQAPKQGKFSFQSQKQVDNQAKRLKNKRIARQRKKQQLKKKLNKKIEYGGMTKFQAQAKQKAVMNNKGLKVDGANMKYNKSSSFFKNINQNKGGKPNPDISKMKI